MRCGSSFGCTNRWRVLSAGEQFYAECQLTINKLKVRKNIRGAKLKERKLMNSFKQFSYLVSLRAIPCLSATTTELISFPGITPITKSS